jgi:hypothetical protein
MSSNVRIILVSAVTAAVVSLLICTAFFGFKMMALEAALGEAKQISASATAATRNYLEDVCREKPDLKRCALLKFRAGAPSQ